MVRFIWACPFHRDEYAGKTRGKSTPSVDSATVSCMGTMLLMYVYRTFFNKSYFFFQVSVNETATFALPARARYKVLESYSKFEQGKLVILVWEHGSFRVQRTQRVVLCEPRSARRKDQYNLLGNLTLGVAEPRHPHYRSQFTYARWGDLVPYWEGRSLISKNSLGLRWENRISSPGCFMQLEWERFSFEGSWFKAELVGTNRGQGVEHSNIFTSNNVLNSSITGNFVLVFNSVSRGATMTMPQQECLGRQRYYFLASEGAIREYTYIISGSIVLAIRLLHK